MKDELIQQLRMLGMGRVNAAQAIADILMPDVTINVPDDQKAAFAEVFANQVAGEIVRVNGPATVEIEYADLAKSTNPSTTKALADTVEEAKKLFEAPPPDPVKPKRKKA